MDLADAVVLIEDGRITAVGPRARVAVPKGYRVVDAAGGYVVPGLIDSFAVCNNQAYANAYLYMGVTSILGVSGGRRGEMMWDADPSPSIYRLEDVGMEAAKTDDLLDRVDELADDGVDVALLMYRMDPAQLRAVAQRARERGMATIGELARAGYRDGLDCGLDAFVHTTRYSLGLAPQPMVDGINEQPFSDTLDSPKWRYYRWLSDLDVTQPATREYADEIARSDTALIPTGGLLHLHRPGAVNPWSFPIAAILDAKDVNMPADPKTGLQKWSAAQRKAYGALAANADKLEQIYHDAGCRHIAGSGTDVWGTMPGISLHTELAFLASLGKTPREALATATSNPAGAFRWRDVGHVRAGSRGDVLVLDRDPRQDIANLRHIRHVVCRGAVLDRDRLLQPPGRDNGKILSQQPWQPSPESKQQYDYLDKVDVKAIRYVSNTLGVTGYLAVPKGEGPFPCVIDVRGGNREFAALGEISVARRIARVASWGYVVASSQYRGVAGGDGLEEFGGAEVADVLNLLAVLEQVAVADTSRVGIYAGSRGGMTACLMMQQSDRFQACVLRAPLTDLVRWQKERPEMTGVFRELIPGYDRDPMGLLTARSGALWAQQLCKTTPIMVLQGTADWRISPGMTLAFAEALQGCKHPYRLAMLDGADHGLRPQQPEARRLARDWLDRFVKNAGR